MEAMVIILSRTADSEDLGEQRNPATSDLRTITGPPQHVAREDQSPAAVC